MKNLRSLIRPLVHELHAYVPGEQPKIKGLIKLNTNENPYPPSPRVLKAVKAATDGRLRLYPNPTAQVLREKLAKLHGCKAENIIIGNGSDELLALAVRAFVEPVGPLRACNKAGKSNTSGAGEGDGSIFSSELFTIPGPGGYSWRREKCGAVECKFCVAECG